MAYPSRKTIAVLGLGLLTLGTTLAVIRHIGKSSSWADRPSTEVSDQGWEVPEDWETYGNEELGFELRYPKEFAYGVCAWVSAEQENPIAIGFDTKALVQQGTVGCDIGVQLYGLIVSFHSGPPTFSIALGPNDEILSSEDINIENYEVKRIVRSDSFSRHDIFYSVYYPENDLSFVFSVYKDSYDDIANHIISTIKTIQEKTASFRKRLLFFLPART